MKDNNESPEKVVKTEIQDFLTKPFNGYAPIKMALQELSDGTINESECAEVIANAYRFKYLQPANNDYAVNESNNISFKPGQYIVFKGETGARWNNGFVYVYLGNGCVTDKDGDVKFPTWPNFINDNFIEYQPNNRLCSDYVNHCLTPNNLTY